MTGISRSTQTPRLKPVSAFIQPSAAKNSALAGVGRPQNSVCCVSSILNLASRSAEKAATTKQSTLPP